MPAPLWVPSAESLFQLDNFGANPSATPATSIVPGASNAEGNWTQLFSALAQDVAGIYLRVSDGNLASNAKPHLLDIGIDRAGGSSYTAIISNIVCGAAGTLALVVPGGHRFFFPMRIPAGATVAVRIQGAHATAGTVRVGMKLYGQLRDAHLLAAGTLSETLGTITNSDGVSFTPGNAADGTWVSLGTSTLDLWWFQLGYQITGTAITTDNTWIELGCGTTGNQRVLLRRAHLGNASEAIGDYLDTQLCWHEGYHPLPAGTEFWVRGRSDAAPDSGYNAAAIGIGG